MSEYKLKCKSCKQSCTSMHDDIEDNGGKPWDLCVGCRCELKSAKVQRERAEKAEARVAELVESEEKAWQTVAKLRVELETTARLRLRMAELEKELKG